MRQTTLLRRFQLLQTLTPKLIPSTTSYNPTTLPIFSPLGRRRGVVGILEGDEVVGEWRAGGNQRFRRNCPAWRIDIDFSTNTKFGRNFQARRLSTLPEDSRSYYSEDLRSCGTTSSVATSSYSCSIFRNFLLSFPVCVSADDCGNRLFLSDSNNHRIIVASDKGEILDCAPQLDSRMVALNLQNCYGLQDLFIVLMKIVYILRTQRIMQSEELI